jgi:hypothetical protein
VVVAKPVDIIKHISTVLLYIIGSPARKKDQMIVSMICNFVMKDIRSVKMHLNDKLYKYLTFSGFSEYKVIAINVSKVILYEIACQSCNHGDRCTLYVVKDERGDRYRFVKMTSNDEDHNHLWHDDDFFYPNLGDAKRAKYKQVLSDKHEELANVQKQVVQIKKEITELQEHYKNIQDDDETPSRN